MRLICWEAVHSWFQCTPSAGWQDGEIPFLADLLCPLSQWKFTYPSLPPSSLQLKKLTVFGAKIGQPLAVGRSFPSLRLSAKWAAHSCEAPLT